VQNKRRLSAAVN